jgi:hypothetical protein
MMFPFLFVGQWMHGPHANLGFAENGVCERQLAEVACVFLWGDRDRLQGVGEPKPRCFLACDELRLHEAKWLRIFELLHGLLRQTSACH